jgi:hypothetical protein
MGGRLSVADVYPVFGTEFLRQTRPLRRLLDPTAVSRTDDDWKPQRSKDPHYDVQSQLQDWLTYHDGVRRRCLVLIDLLWAEAARLEDLPPEDVRKAADAKLATGGQNRKRVLQECLRLRGARGLAWGLLLSRFLRRAEYRTFWHPVGLSRNRLQSLDDLWTGRLLWDCAEASEEEDTA